MWSACRPGRLRTVRSRWRPSSCPSRGSSWKSRSATAPRAARRDRGCRPRERPSPLRASRPARGSARHGDPRARASRRHRRPGSRRDRVRQVGHHQCRHPLAQLLRGPHARRAGFVRDRPVRQQHPHLARRHAGGDLCRHLRGHEERGARRHEHRRLRSDRPPGQEHALQAGRHRRDDRVLGMGKRLSDREPPRTRRGASSRSSGGASPIISATSTPWPPGSTKVGPTTPRPRAPSRPSSWWRPPTFPAATAAGSICRSPASRRRRRWRGTPERPTPAAAAAATGASLRRRGERRRTVLIERGLAARLAPARRKERAS